MDRQEFLHIREAYAVVHAKKYGERYPNRRIGNTYARYELYNANSVVKRYQFDDCASAKVVDAQPDEPLDDLILIDDAKMLDVECSRKEEMSALIGILQDALNNKNESRALYILARIILTDAAQVQLSIEEGCTKQRISQLVDRGVIEARQLLCKGGVL